jgi:hypothetical protein
MHAANRPSTPPPKTTKPIQTDFPATEVIQGLSPATDFHDCANNLPKQSAVRTHLPNATLHCERLDTVRRPPARPSHYNSANQQNQKNPQNPISPPSRQARVCPQRPISAIAQITSRNVLQCGRIFQTRLCTASVWTRCDAPLAIPSQFSESAKPKESTKPDQPAKPAGQGLSPATDFRPLPQRTRRSAFPTALLNMRRFLFKFGVGMGVTETWG